MSAGSAVLLRGVVKTYGRGDALVHALRGADLEVASGELMMLVGPSGCGKTTLISVAAGVLDHDAGSCVVFGQDLDALSARELVRFRGRTIGFVFQAFNLLPALSAAENVAVPLFLQDVPRREALRRAGALLDRVGLGGRERALPGELSGGQQQRVAIARSVVHEPRLVVCDEPTSALDQETGHKVMELLKSLAVGDGRALLIVTHDPRIFPFADRIAHMNDGRIDRVSARAEAAGKEAS
jgi:putative ABC transport system ATP-binding protein